MNYFKPIFMLLNLFKTLTISLLFFISTNINSQIKPYLIPQSSAELNTAHLKKRTILNKKDICRNKINDTLSIDLFNSKRQNNKSFRYRDNKLEYYTISTFTNKNNSLKHDTFHTDQKRGNSIITIEYKNDKEIKCGNYDLNSKKDTIFKNVGIKKYNKNGDLIKETTTLGLDKEYRYNSKNQKTEDIIRSAFRIERTYYHYKEDLVARTESYLIHPSKPKDSTLDSYHNYDYNYKKQLVRETYKTSSSQDEQINHYEYNSNDQLIKMNLKRGTNFMYVEYQYNKNKRIKEIVNSNNHIGMAEFYIPLSSCFLPKNKEFNYEVNYFYDSENNLIKIDRYIDNELKISTEYLLEYY